MPLRFPALALAVALLFASAAPSLAQPESVPLGDGSSVTVNQYLVETDGEGRKILVIRAEPEFDPEPYGPVPSDSYARVLKMFCDNLVNNSWDALQEDSITGVRVRWDFTPTQVNEEAKANGITFTRFHEALFELRRDRSCLLMPSSVRMDDLAPVLPSGAPAKLEYAEYGPYPGELRLTYRYGSSLLEADQAMLERSAIELCILHADGILKTHAQYYPQRDIRSVTIVYYRDEGQGQATTRQMSFPVFDGVCQTGLSQMLTDAIRSAAGAA